MFSYNPWHIDRNLISSKDPIQCLDEDEVFLHVQNDSKKHEWEIILGLYKNKYIHANEFDMIGFRDHCGMNNWSSSYVDEETSRCATNFISSKKNVNAIVTTESLKKYSFESLGEKQKINITKEMEKKNPCI